MADRPETRRLAQRFAVTGVDISPRQVERARAAIPEASSSAPTSPSSSCRPARSTRSASFYVFNHVPRELLAPLLASIHGWLVPGGWLLTAFGQSDNPGLDRANGSARRRSSRASRRRSTRGSSGEAGFAIERDEIVAWESPDGPERFQWVLAQA